MKLISPFAKRFFEVAVVIRSQDTKEMRFKETYVAPLKKKDYIHTFFFLFCYIVEMVILSSCSFAILRTGYIIFSQLSIFIYEFILHT